MVRAIVGTLVLVGKGKMTEKEFVNILIGGNRSDAGESVPACGLFLNKVTYTYIGEKNGLA
jgi:tRNA pseudouridine38-40 synthase